MSSIKAKGAQVVGFDLSPNKRIKIALRAITGIGFPLALKICGELGCDPMIFVRDLSPELVQRFHDHIRANYLTGNDLQLKVAREIKALKIIRCFRGRRHELKMPARGQRTSSNARTVRGKSKAKSSGAAPRKAS